MFLVGSASQKQRGSAGKKQKTKTKTKQNKTCMYMFHAIWKPRAGTTCTCVLWRDNFKENRENCHDFIVLYCVRNWEGISVVENLVRHNNRSFRANKLVIVSPNYKKKTNNNHCQKDRGYFPLGYVVLSRS